MKSLLLATATLLSLGTAAAGVDSRGPVTYPGMAVTVDAQGVQAPGYRFQNDTAKPTPWQAQWVWLADETSATAAMFRREVTLPEAPRSVRAWLTADMKYLLYVNGRLVSRGPVDIGRDYAGGNTHRWFYDGRDLTPFFTPGTNVITAEVFRSWPVGFTVSRGQPGFLFEAEITGADGRKTTVKSDDSWRALAAAQFPDATNYDARREPAGWRLAGFDDSTWPAARAVKDVWETRVPSEIPPLMEARYPVARCEGLPANRLFTTNGSFQVVFDRALSAFPTLEVRGGKDAELTVHAHHSFKIRLAGGKQYFEFPFMDEIAPAYTVTLANVTEPVEITDAGANFTSQPLAYRGAFACSDTNLNRLWEVSRWAVQICLQTHHLDSPNHQEPISDPGDYLIESMVNHYAFAQPWLARQDLRKFGWLLQDLHDHNFHTSYSLAWLQMLLDYYDYTGDASLVREEASTVDGLLDTYTGWRGTNGLISEAPNYMFMDWVTIGGFACHHPPAVIGQGYLTAFYYHGLELAARVSQLTGDDARVAKYAGLRRATAAAFNRGLWVPAQGLYRDGKPFQTSVKPCKWLPADTDIETFSPHVNLLAVLYDLAPREQQPAIVDKVLSESPLNTQPWFMHWVFPAIDHAGEFERYGFDQLRRWQISPATQTFREMWTKGDYSHGWCSTPLVQLSAHVLGVTPTEPGFQTIAIRPEPGDLAWAKGSVPTPHGDVAVSWVSGADRFTLDVTIPDGTGADVILPVARFPQAVATLNGRACPATVHVGSGTWHLEVKAK